MQNVYIDITHIFLMKFKINAIKPLVLVLSIHFVIHYPAENFRSFQT